MNSAKRFFMPVFLFIVAYEWLISVSNKLLTKNYFKNLHDQLSQSVSGIQFHPYATLLTKVGLHQIRLIGSLVVIAELFVGITFVVAGIALLRHQFTPKISTLGLIAAIVAAFMSLNYALLGGDTLFVNTANAFQEGISVDWVLCLMEIALALYFFSHSRTTHAPIED